VELAAQVVTRVPPLGQVPVSAAKHRQKELDWQHIGHAAGFWSSHVVSVPVRPARHPHPPPPCTTAHAPALLWHSHDELGPAGHEVSAQHTVVALGTAGHCAVFALA
jgi:hypothetical protein